MIDPRLEGRTVLITGANHGIGAAIARAFAKQSAKVFITSYRPRSERTEAELQELRDGAVGGPALYEAMQQQAAAPLVNEIVSQGSVAVSYETDLGNAANIPLLFDRCEAELGPVDVLVNNHTCCVLETFDPELVTDDGFRVHLPTADCIDAHFAVNSRAVALMMSEYFQRYLKRQGQSGRVVNVSTDAAHAHAANISYAASKHAIESYSRSAAIEMGKYGITINIVAPGPIQTGYLTAKEESAIAVGTPLRRVGRPEDVADVVVFLASEQAHWLTGQLLYVGGGWRMHQ